MMADSAVRGFLATGSARPPATSVAARAPAPPQPSLAQDRRGRLYVWLYSASNLKASDFNGKSDAYVVFKLGSGAEHKSTVSPPTLNPTWGERSSGERFHLGEFALDAVLDHRNLLSITVFDEDKGRVREAGDKKDDKIGECTVHLLELERESAHTYRDVALKPKGTLTFAVHFEEIEEEGHQARRYVGSGAAGSSARVGGYHHAPSAAIAGDAPSAAACAASASSSSRYDLRGGAATATAPVPGGQVGHVGHASASLPTGASAEEVFNRVALGGRGTLFAAELQQALRLMGVGFGAKELDAVLGRYDHDHDGGLDLSEFKVLHRDVDAFKQQWSQGGAAALDETLSMTMVIKDLAAELAHEKSISRSEHERQMGVLGERAERAERAAEAEQRKALGLQQKLSESKGQLRALEQQLQAATREAGDVAQERNRIGRLKAEHAAGLRNERRVTEQAQQRLDEEVAALRSELEDTRALLRRAEQEADKQRERARQSTERKGGEVDRERRELESARRKVQEEALEGREEMARLARSAKDDKLARQQATREADKARRAVGEARALGEEARAETALVKRELKAAAAQIAKQLHELDEWRSKAAKIGKLEADAAYAKAQLAEMPRLRGLAAEAEGAKLKVATLEAALREQAEQQQQQAQRQHAGAAEAAEAAEAATASSVAETDRERLRAEAERLSAEAERLRAALLDEARRREEAQARLASSEADGASKAAEAAELARQLREYEAEMGRLRAEMRAELRAELESEPRASAAAATSAPSPAAKAAAAKAPAADNAENAPPPHQRLVPAAQQPPHAPHGMPHPQWYHPQMPVPTMMVYPQHMRPPHGGPMPLYPAPAGQGLHVVRHAASYPNAPAGVYRYRGD